MKNHIRMSVAFARYPNARLGSFALLALFCLKDNPLFPNIPVTITQLAALAKTLQDGMTAAAQGGAKARAALREARGELILALRKITGYIQSLGLTKESDALSSGFDVVGWDTSQKTLEAPVLKWLDNSVPGQLGVKLAVLRNARVYEVEYRTGSGEWTRLGYFVNTRGIVIPDTVAGMVYSARVRAVGGSTKLSSWSATVSVMSM